MILFRISNSELSKKIIVVAGPTASGKTAAAIQLALRHNTAIISADSRQCYREMRIGTAAPSAEELALVKHYFIASHSVTDEVSAADFERLALGWLEEIFAEKDVAVVCGGTGLYLKALLHGLDDMPAADPEVVRAIQQEYARHGIGWLQEKVSVEDPAWAALGDTRNPARLQRALGFVRSTGESITKYQSGQKKERLFSVETVLLELPRAAVYDRINRRVDNMMRAGLLEEVRSLLPYRHLKSLQTVGYSEIFDYLDGAVSLEEAVAKIKQHTRNYAKRQETWFRKYLG